MKKLLFLIPLLFVACAWNFETTAHKTNFNGRTETVYRLHTEVSRQVNGIKVVETVYDDIVDSAGVETAIEASKRLVESISKQPLKKHKIIYTED